MFAILVHGTVAHSSAINPISNPPVLTSEALDYSQNPQNLLEQARLLYESGRFADAATVLQQAVTIYRSQGDSLSVAAALSNLSLAEQQLGNWAEANQAIEQALALLQSDPLPDHSAILSQALEIQGRLYLAQGDAEAALTTWEQAESLYDRLDDQNGIVRSGINQAQALQTLGLYRRAIATLEQLTASFTSQPPSRSQVVALRSLGDALRVVGNLNRAVEVLNQSLNLAQQLQLPQEIAATQLSLGNAVCAQGDVQQAQDLYQQAIDSSSSTTTQVRAQLNQLRLLIATQQDATIQTLLPVMLERLNQLPSGRPAIYARINLAHSLTKWENPQWRTGDGNKTIAQLLATAVQQAQSLRDVRAESFAWGNLGELYEQQRQWANTEQVTTTALQLANQIEANDLIYRWQWQLGRVLNQQQQREPAIAAYAEAVGTLQLLRSDLTATNSDVQFSFRESVEPVYRQFVALLLEPGEPSTKSELELARSTIESLQLAELDNFFRTACLNAQERQVDEIDRRAAVLYPIILDDRLEVILSLPDGELRRYTANDANREKIEANATQLLAFLRQVTSNNRVLPVAQQFYDWLIRPAEVDLASSEIETLVFVLDGGLRNIPMGVLHDGTEYLVEKPYSLALAPGLQLLESQPLQPRQFSVLLGGLSEARPPDFPPLSNVVTEFAGIEAEVTKSQELLNDRFTNDEIQKAINAVPFPVVHLATHGVFDSTQENTFILTWNDRIDINTLSTLLQSTELGRRRPIELLVLSACETAEGDDRAALGLAGVAVRAGARSTVATLWQVNDEAMSVLMQQFYQALVNVDVTKAEALRQSQLSLLRNTSNREYSKPYYWSPVVLIGNWQ